MSDQLLDILSDLVGQAKTAGADAADAVAVRSRTRGISVRGGALEDVEGSESSDVGLRVMIGTRQAVASSSDMGAEALKSLVERTLQMAKLVPDDPYCGLAPEDMLAADIRGDLELADTADPASDTLKTMALEVEDAALSVKGVTTCDGASASAGQSEAALVTSHGFAGHYRGTSYSCSVSAVAGEGTAMERDYDFDSKRHFSDLRSPAQIGRVAGDQAIARLKGQKLASGDISVVFDPRVSRTLLGHFIGAINGSGIARKSSFLLDAMDTEVFSDSITIIDDPFLKRGMASKPYDGEGVRVEPTALVEEGILQSWMLNRAAAAQLGLPLTGHGSRGVSSPPGIGGSNTYIAPSETSPTDLMSDIKDGFYVTELIGMGVNGVTGDYSRGAAGFRIENGNITTPVTEVTIASNLKTMFAGLTVGNDLEFRYGINAPTVRIDRMMLAGA